jgi:tetratricopeptide (TPR) repeat protein
MAIAILFAQPAAALAQDSENLRRGIALYNEENFEKAIAALNRARTEAPASAEAAFYLGMAYRQTHDIRKAYAQFKDAVQLDPLTDNAILQLIEAATLLKEFDTAKEWIAFAEEHEVYPARVAFLKGTALSKQGQYGDAVAAFEKSKRLDPANAQAADLQIGICRMNQRQYKSARDHFQSTMDQDPLSEMAAYAFRYKEIAEQWQYLERPLRLTISSMARYDTNYQELPKSSAALPAAVNAYIENRTRESLALQNIALLGYAPLLPAPFSFNASYMAVSTIHQRHGTDNDELSNSFTMAPGIDFDGFTVSLMAGYTHTLRRDDGYKRYSESGSIGPLVRFLPGKNHMLETGVNFLKENYSYTVANPAEEDESSRGLQGSVNWFWLFRENGLFNLKLDYTQKNAAGSRYDNRGYRASAGLIHPLGDKLRLQMGGDFRQVDYENGNSLFGNAVRQDRIYTGTLGVTWSVFKQMDLIARYLYMQANSNIPAYDYNRKIYSLGMELKF